MSAATGAGQAGAGAAVAEAIATALRGRAELAGVALFDGGAGVLPRIEIAEPQGADWSAKDFCGRELRTAVTVRVGEGQRGRMAALIGAVEAAGESLGGDIAGWRVVSALFLRTRGAVERGGHAALIEHRVRVMRIN